MNRIWEKDGARVSAKADRGLGGNIVYRVELVARLRPDVVSGRQRVFLTAEYERSRQRIYIEDVVGNGYDSGIQGIGTGTLLVNTAIQMFRGHHPPGMAVEGHLSSQGDPDDAKTATHCHTNRVRFWAGYGLHDAGRTLYGALLKGTLQDMEARRVDRTILGRIPVMIRLDEFREADHN